MYMKQKEDEAQERLQQGGEAVATVGIDKDSALAQTYGSTMNEWCVGHVQDFTGMFGNMPNFNEDISAWNMSAATAMDRQVICGNLQFMHFRLKCLSFSHHDYLLEFPA